MSVMGAELILEGRRDLDFNMIMTDYYEGLFYEMKYICVFFHEFKSVFLLHAFSSSRTFTTQGLILPRTT